MAAAELQEELREKEEERLRLLAIRQVSRKDACLARL